jgi:hypothetical protein
MCNATNDLNFYRLPPEGEIDANVPSTLRTRRGKSSLFGAAGSADVHCLWTAAITVAT